MGRRRTLAACLALVAALCCLAASADAGTDASGLVRFAAGFDAGVRPGASTALHLSVRVSLALPPVTEVRVLTPGGMGLSTSRLGATACRRPAREVASVMGPVRHDRCPANSLMGSGTATAGLLLSEEQTIFGAAQIHLYAGASVDDKPGLLVTADAYNPVRLQLTYAGYLYVPPDAFGVGLAIRVLPIPRPPLGAPIALSTFDVVVGRSSITYYRRVDGRRVPYHPGGIPVPTSCPSGGFRFRAILRFADGSRRSADSVVPCPLAG